MFQHRVYQCPKCYNTLLVSNKMLHDLRCTVENPATYENILFRQSQLISNDSSYYNNYNNQYNTNSSQRFSARKSIKNNDGTMVDIVKEKNMRGKEEYIEIKYDPEGNIISRKRAGESIGYTEEPQNLHEISEYNEYDNNYETSYDNNNNTYYEVNNEVEIKNTPSVIYETAEAQEIVYTAPPQYDPHVTINKPIEETFISNDAGISDGALNTILRNTMNMSNNSGNNYNYNIQNDMNLNGYNMPQNYSQNDVNMNINTNTYGQSYDINNYTSQNYDIGNNNGNLNYSSYDYQY